MVIRLLLAVLVATASCSALATTDSSSESTSVLILGDSLSAAHRIKVTDGWVHLLEHRLMDAECPATVVNASISGETTAGGLARLPDLLASHQPALVIIELGANDALRGAPIDRIRANLSELIELAQDAQAQVMLLGIQIPTNYGQRYGRAFANLYPLLSKAYGTELVPFFLEGIALNPELMQADRLHPNEAAQPIIVENVYETLTTALPCFTG